MHLSVNNDESARRGGSQATSVPCASRQRCAFVVKSSQTGVPSPVLSQSLCPVADLHPGHPPQTPRLHKAHNHK